MRNSRNSLSSPGFLLGKGVRHVRICRASVKLNLVHSSLGDGNLFEQ